MAKPKPTSVDLEPTTEPELSVDGDRPTRDVSEEFTKLADDISSKSTSSSSPAALVEVEAAPSPTAAAPPIPTRAEARAARTTYTVWPYGELHRNGKIYKPGDTIALSPEDAAKIPCLVVNPG